MSNERPIIIQEGIDLAENADSIQEASRVDTVVNVHHVDPVRDDDVGINISQYNLNYMFQPRDPRDYLLRSVVAEPLEEVELPSSVDLRNEWGTVYDQGSLGSCVANCVAGCIRFARKKLNMTVYDPSRTYIYYYGRVLENFPINEDTGLYIRSGFKSVAQYSVCSEKHWPYKISKFTHEPSPTAKAAAKQHRTFDYFALEDEPTILKKCLADGFPIAFGFTVFDSFMSATTARTGVVSLPASGERVSGGHAMTIVGYDDDKKHYIVANSWSKDWGDQGFCYFPYEFMSNDKWCGDFWTARRFSK